MRKLAPSGQASVRSIELAGQIASILPLAAQSICDRMRLGDDAPIDTALTSERRYFEQLFDRLVHKEDMRALLEKCAPLHMGH